MHEPPPPPPDSRTVIHTDRWWEVLDWSKRLGCSLEALQEAIVAVGPESDNVRAYLAHRRQERVALGLPSQSGE